MILWFIKISIISILLIIIVHHLFIFLQNNFSIPIIKDFVNIPEQYENMLNVIEEKDVSLINDLPITNKLEENIKENIKENIEEINEEHINMKDELKKFLNSEL